MTGDNLNNIKETDKPTNNAASETLTRLQNDCIPNVSTRNDKLVAFADFKSPAATKGIKPLEIIKGNDQPILNEKGAKPDIAHTEHGFTLNFKHDHKGNLTEVKTTFNKKDDGSKRPDQTYVKKSDGWFYKSSDGKEMRMQGDLRVNEEGKFTQVLRRDIDGEDNGNKGGAKETTRTMDIDGTDTINRMDGSQSIFKYNEKGKMTEWIEKDGKDNEQKFSLTEDGKGWKNAAGEIRHNPKVEDNGNVTYKKASDLDKKTNQVVTSSGDQIVNGENGVNYAFNSRGDVASIQFPNSRLFEGRRVNRVDIAYRDPTGNQGQIIDRLTLYDAKNNAVSKFERVTDKDKTAVALDQWNVSDARGGKYHQVGKSIGDFAIKNGLIKTTEPLPSNKEQLEKFMSANPNIKKAVDAYKTYSKADPKIIVCTYKNSKETSKTNQPNNDEYEIEVHQSDKLDYPVPGEESFSMPIFVPAPPPPVDALPPIDIKESPAPTIRRAIRPSRPSTPGDTRTF